MPIFPEDLVQRIVAEFPSKEDVIRRAVRDDVVFPIMDLLMRELRCPDLTVDIANFKDGKFEKVCLENKRVRLEDLADEIQEAVLS